MRLVERAGDRSARPGAAHALRSAGRNPPGSPAPDRRPRRQEALKLHHFSDLSVDAGPPASVFRCRSSFTRLKALAKKSISSACWPIFRSSSAILFAAASSLLPVAGRLDPTAFRVAGLSAGSIPLLPPSIGIPPAVQDTALYVELVVHRTDAFAAQDALGHRHLNSLG